MIKNGTYVYYQIEWRVRASGAWGAPDSPIKTIPPEMRGDWRVCSFSYWGKGLNPWSTGSGTPVDRAASKEFDQVRADMGEAGWWSLEHAQTALARLERLDAEDYFSDGCRYFSDGCRYEFRIACVRLQYHRTGHVVPQAQKREQKRKLKRQASQPA